MASRRHYSPNKWQPANNLNNYVKSIPEGRTNNQEVTQTLADSQELTSRALLLFLDQIDQIWIDEIWNPKNSGSTEM
jgi:hypothetical protein